MPGRRDQLTQRMPGGCVIKVLILYDHCFWRSKGYSGEVLTTDGPVCLFYDASTYDNKQPALVAFVAGKAAIEWSGREQELQTTIIKQLVDLYGPDAAKVKKIILKDWSLESYSRGCYVGVMPSGMLTTFGKALREPVGRIHWAGTETATEWIGYMEGAIVSGIRAAKEVSERLTKSSSTPSSSSSAKL
eukprot:TRINITY_DN5484_c0_g1_i1.p1 TRINITY_DN5484_c0_g1~~TRINITY_DN5484_c0_g1_i1.p1  ORF type:complete len:189 (-),score=36.34 TRINITY_DN5484_c0_g1_i1:159-725(-)